MKLRYLVIATVTDFIVKKEKNQIKDYAKV